MFWRQAGLNYLQYSAVCARILRRCLQENLRKDAVKREENYAKVNKWVDGKMVGQKSKD